MKFYELTYLISPELSEEELKSLREKISSLIQKEGGVLNEINFPNKKSLFFPIKKQKEAFFADLNFYLEAEKLGNLEKELKSEKKILRYLILTKKIPSAAQSRHFLRRGGILAGKKVSEVKTKPSKKLAEPKVELKDIEKKLEEILGE
jgi:small subunit ribosomal protein S6